MKAPKMFSKKVRLGRIGMPLWSLALAGIAIVAAAGQAVGPVLSGSVTGAAGLTVEQSVVLDTGSTIAFTNGHGDDALGVMNDEGTNFSAAIEMHVGDTITVNLPVTNVSDADANAVLELSMPAGVDVEVDSDGASASIAEAQMTKNAWLLSVDTGASDNLTVTISPKDDLMPGFYTIAGRIVQITG